MVVHSTEGAKMRKTITVSLLSCIMMFSVGNVSAETPREYLKAMEAEARNYVEVAAEEAKKAGVEVRETLLDFREYMKELNQALREAIPRDEANQAKPANESAPCTNITQVTENYIPYITLGICTPSVVAIAKTRGRVRAANYCRRTCESTGSKKVKKIRHTVAKKKHISGGMCEIRTVLTFDCL